MWIHYVRYYQEVKEEQWKLTTGFGEQAVSELDNIAFRVVLGIKPDWKCAQKKTRD